jgi:hypothetical protein
MKLKSSLLGKTKKMFLLVFGRAASSALECGGTTPLWVERNSRDNHHTARHVARTKSGVVPPHSKDNPSPNHKI